MQKCVYYPEGFLIGTEENAELTASAEGLARAMQTGRIVEGRALVCDERHNLIVSLGDRRGIIPREEAAVGISEGKTKDIAIISRVGKPVCFRVMSLCDAEPDGVVAVLSRRAAQQECEDYLLSTLVPGDILPGRVTHLEPFGSFVDIGCGVVSLISIDNISVSRISHPRDRFYPGQNIRAVVREIDRENRRITLTHKELLGTWSQNAELFAAGQTVAGIVRTVEDYGVFVELTPNLAGLAEPREGIRPGQRAAVYIKSILPEKMKVKLAIIDVFDDDESERPRHDYFVEGEHIDRWEYSPPGCEKRIETVFS